MAILHQHPADDEDDLSLAYLHSFKPCQSVDFRLSNVSIWNELIRPNHFLEQINTRKVMSEFSGRENAGLPWDTSLNEDAAWRRAQE